MILMNIKEIQDCIAPLPPRLRSWIFSRISSIIEEATAIGKSEEEIGEEIIDFLLQELFSNLVEPIEMLDEMLKSKLLQEITSFKIEFSEILFDQQFIEKTRGFQNEFWSLVEELGRLESIRSKKNPLNWKGEHTQ